MKRLLLVLAVLVLVCPAIAFESTNLQDPGHFLNTSNTTDLTCYGSSACAKWIPGNNARNGAVVVQGNDVCMENSIGSPMDYWAASTITHEHNGYTYTRINFKNSEHANLYTISPMSNSPYGAGQYDRLEMEMVGGTLYWYRNGILGGNSTPLSVNPSFVCFYAHNYPGGGEQWYVDDWVQGSTTDKTILGLPMSDQFYIKKDMVNPGASGVYNATTPAAPVDSNILYATFSLSNITDTPIANESVYLINTDTGVVYETQYTGFKATGTLQYNVGSSLIAASAPYGRYSLKLGTTISDQWINYIANGANIAFDKDEYSQQDQATITYLIDGAYWDTSTYTYSMKIYEGNTWGVVDTQAVSASSGTFTYTFTDSNPQGEYYAVIGATPNTGGDFIWMQYDYAALEAYVKFIGYVNTAQNATAISGANVSFTQNGLVSNSFSGVDGNYTADGFLTGAVLTINVTAPSHSQYLATLTPMVAKSISLNITLNATAPTYTGLGIGGIARAGVFDGTIITKGYGEPISGATVMMVNTSNGESYTKTTNNAGWYLCDEGSSCLLTTKRPYDVWGSKIGYSNSQNYTVVAA